MGKFHKHFRKWRGDSRRAWLARVVECLRVLPSNERWCDSFAPLDPPVETSYVSILHNSAFRRSVMEVKDSTCLDVARLANLWTTIRSVGSGVFLEVGSFRGGTALHICNAIEEFNPGQPFYCFDPFENAGFEMLGECDAAFRLMDFTETKYRAVVEMLASKPNAHVVQGFFPEAAQGTDFQNIAFCHLDVDVYQATRQSLEFLAPRMAPRSAVVLDDLDHAETPGVRKAAEEFLTAHPEFVMIPMFPCQGALFSTRLW